MLSLSLAVIGLALVLIALGLEDHHWWLAVGLGITGAAMIMIAFLLIYPDFLW